MKGYSTLILKLAILGASLVILFFAILGIIGLIKDPVNPTYGYILYPIVSIIYLSLIPIYYGLWNAYLLISLVDHKEAFSMKSVSILTKLTWISVSFGSLFVIALPFVYMLAQLDDAPGLVLMGMVPVAAGFILSIIFAVVKRLLEEAIQMKEEIDLTV